VGHQGPAGAEHPTACYLRARGGLGQGVTLSPRSPAHSQRQRSQARPAGWHSKQMPVLPNKTWWWTSKQEQLGRKQKTSERGGRQICWNYGQELAGICWHFIL